MSDVIIKERNNKSFYSQAANNKIKGITESITSTNNNITIISSGLMNNKTLKKYKKVYDKQNGIDIIYSEIIDAPLINTLSSIWYIYKEIKILNKEKHIDNIIFYNYKPEVAWAALIAKKRLKIPITIEYEDGYSNTNNFGKFKSTIFKFTEKKVSKNVDSAILINSTLKKEYNVPSIVVRGVVNKQFYEECKNYKKKDNDIFTILYSGGLDETRGINVLIESLKYIPFNLKLIITGKGNVDFEDKRIDFKGFISYEEMKKMMVQADLLVQCQLVNNSFNDVSFPSKIFEYIATNNFIISSKVADITEFAKNDILYYDNDNSNDLANKIIEIYEIWKNKNGKKANFNKLCEENLPEKIGIEIINILN
jgi:glycosyltransferase involved in cell wall biosynthesis